MNHNSSITSSAYSLGVHPDVLALWLETVAPRPGNSPKRVELNEVGNEMANIIETSNPELARRWRMANYYHSLKPRT